MSTERKKSVQITERAKLNISVPRCGKHAKSKKVVVGKLASIYLAAVAEYVVTEILELAGEATKSKRIKQKEILKAIRTDASLNEAFRNGIVLGGGVLPQMHEVLLLKSRTKKAAPEAEVEA